MSKNVNIRDLLEKADKTLNKKRSNDPECPFSQFLPEKKNMRYNLRNTSVSVPRIYTDRFKNVFGNRIIFVSSTKHRHYEKMLKSSGKCFIYGKLVRHTNKVSLRFLLRDTLHEAFFTG